MSFRIVLTIDVESTKDVCENRIVHREYFQDIEKPVKTLLRLLDRYELKAVFMYPLGELHKDYPESIKLGRTIIEKGHELSLHLHRGFNLMTEDESSELIEEEMDLFRKYLNYTPVSGRAGGFNTGRNNQWIKALRRNGIKFDSSVVPGLNCERTAFWSDHAIKREEERWGKNSCFMDCRGMPLNGIYGAGYFTGNDVDNSLLEFPVSVKSYSENKVEMLDLQNLQTEDFDRFVRIAKVSSSEKAAVVTLVSFAHSLGNYNKSAFGLRETKHMKSFRKNLKLIAGLKKAGELENCTFSEISDSEERNYKVEHSDLVSSVSDKLKDFVVKRDTLFIRSAPEQIVLNILDRIPDKNLDTILVQSNISEKFENEVKHRQILKYRSNFFTVTGLTLFLRKYRNQFRQALFVYNNDKHEGYSNIEIPLLINGIRSVGISKNCDDYIELSWKKVLRKFLKAKRNAVAEKSCKFRDLFIKAAVNSYYFLKVLLFIPLNLIYNISLRFRNAGHSESYLPFKEVVSLREFIEPVIEYYRTDERALESLKRRVDNILGGKVNILGYSNLCYRQEEQIHWHKDISCGRNWDLSPSSEVKFGLRGMKGDIKIPWELSRFHHLFRMACYSAVCENEDDRREVVRDIKFQIKNWIENNPPGLGVNWMMPMEAGIRALNLIFIMEIISKDLVKAEKQEVLASLYEHGEFIYNNLEYRSGARGNHYMSNIIALLYLGIYLGESGGEDWFRFSLSEFIRELDFQFNEDGTSKEGSTRYHLLQTELVFLGIRLIEKNYDLKKVFPRWCLERIDKIKMFNRRLTAYSRVPAFGDDDSGTVLPWDSINARDNFLFSDSFPEQKGTECFPEGGFFFINNRQESMIIRCGAIGYNGAGIHDHCDQLSFEFYSNDEVFFCDPGTYVYTSDYDQRNWFRSTAQHNTLQISDMEQNVFREDNLFSMEDCTQSRCLEWSDGDEKTLFHGMHSGFGRNGTETSHERRVWVSEDIWYVSDSVKRLPQGRDVSITLNTGSNIRVESEEETVEDIKPGILSELMSNIDHVEEKIKFKKIVLKAEISGLRVWLPDSDDVEIEFMSSEVSEKYGYKESSLSLKIRLSGGRSKFIMAFEPEGGNRDG